MRLYLCCLLLLFNTTLFSQDNSDVQNSDLAKELLAMKKEEQKMRVQYGKMIRANKTETKKYKSLVDELVETDRSNTARMKEIVQQYGWPTYDLVGKNASNAAWILVQHADRDPLFQSKCLPMLKDAVDNEQASKYCYAYLYDRVQVAFGRKQLYATQSSSNNGLTEGEFYPLEDESNVQKRREEMEISEHVSETAKSYGFSYSVPSEEEAEIRANQLEVKYQNQLELAENALEAEQYSEAADHYFKVLECRGLTTAKDYHNAAKALSLSDHENIANGVYFLLQAAILGHKDVSTYLTDPQFQSLKEASPRSWFDLENTIYQLNNNTPTNKTENQP